MKLISVIILTFFLNPGYSQSSKLQGTWTECFKYDSLEAFQCSKGFQTYHVDSSGNFISEDSMICNSIKKEATGRWQIFNNNLVIYHNTTECITEYPSNTYQITWVNSNLFYSTYISKIEASDEKSFTVFRRLK